MALIPIMYNEEGGYFLASDGLNIPRYVHLPVVLTTETTVTTLAQVSGLDQGMRAGSHKFEYILKCGDSSFDVRHTDLAATIIWQKRLGTAFVTIEGMVNCTVDGILSLWVGDNTIEVGSASILSRLA